MAAEICSLPTPLLTRSEWNNQHLVELSDHSLMVQLGGTPTDSLLIA